MTRHELAPFTLYVEIIPVRADLTAGQMAREVSQLLRGLTTGLRVDEGHVSDRRWSRNDPDAQASLRPVACAAHMTVAEVADLLGRSPAAVRRLIRDGTIKAIRQVDRSYRIPRASLRQLIEEEE